jgi:dTMP kinase
VRTEILAFHTARAELVANVIAPALESGKNVISNRFELSAFAYQIYGREHPELLPFMQTLSAFVIQDCVPDLCIFLDAPPRVALARTLNRAEEPSRFDEESISFHERVYGGYKKHLNDFGRSVTVDSSHTIDDVWTVVEDAVQSVL